MDPILERYQALEDQIRSYNPGLDTKRLYDAFSYADNAHTGQLRKDGSPYITHPLAVAEIAAELELDTDSIIASLLHDRSRIPAPPMTTSPSDSAGAWPIWWTA